MSGLPFELRIGDDRGEPLGRLRLVELGQQVGHLLPGAVVQATSRPWTLGRTTTCPR